VPTPGHCICRITIAYFTDKFGTKIDDDEVNTSHQIIIVAAELDNGTERIVNYLNDSDIPVNVIFFKVYEDGGNRYISRAWLIDPAETSDIIRVKKEESAPWNGEYYSSFGDAENRSWG
jgi:hypothetical protein